MMLFGIGLSLVATAANQDLPGYGTVNLEIYYLDASAQGISDKEPMEYAYCVYYSEELSIAAIMRVWEAGNVVLPDHVTINGKSYPVVGL